MGIRIGAASVWRDKSGKVRVTVGSRIKLGGTAAAVTVEPPPSVNTLFATVGKRRVKSRGYKAWLGRVLPILTTLAPPEAYPVRLWLTLMGAANEARDWDNFVKPLQDALVVAGVLAADDLRHVSGGSFAYLPDGGPARIRVTFE